MRNRLFNPGPVTLSPAVRSALLSPDLCHREPRFADLQNDVRASLAEVYGAESEYDAVLLTGSGSAAVEAMLDSLVGRDSQVLVASNGVYGERMAAILEIHGKPHQVQRGSWHAPLDLAAIAARLDADDRITHVATVHHETTTGRLNPIDGLGDICRTRGVKLLLDAVSSYGAEELDLVAWNVEACASTANKCLHGVPGIAFVVAQKSRLVSGSSGAGTLYLDLIRNYQQQVAGSTLFTPAVQSLYALHAALAEFASQGGWKARRATYVRRSERLIRGYKSLGLVPWIADDAQRSSSLTSFHLPANVRFSDLFESLRERGLIIYPGQGPLSDEIFRVAVMGDLAESDLDELITYTGRQLPKHQPQPGDRISSHPTFGLSSSALPSTRPSSMARGA